MDLQRTLLIAGLVVVGYLMVLQWNQDYNQPQPISQTAQQHTGSTPDAPGIQATTDVPAISGGDTNNQAGTAPTPSAQLITITTDTLILTVDTLGGDIVRAELPQFTRTKGETTPFILLENTANRMFVAQSGLAGLNGPNRLGKPQYSADSTRYTMGDKETLTVDLMLETDSNVAITKRLTFQRGAYQIGVDYIIHNGSDSSWQGNFYGQFKRDNSADPSREMSKSSGMNTYLGAAVRSNEKLYEKLAFSDFGSEPFKEDVEGGYAAVVQHYFVSAWIPKQEQNNTFTTRIVNDENIVSVIEPAVTIAPDQNATVGATLYLGPKNQDRLSVLAKGLDLTIDYGMLWWFAKPLFMLLNLLQSLLGNWGWSIITLTIIVKSLFYPLSATSYRSMAKMRKLGPKMEVLKEKHSEDRQALSQAMMTLYKEEKVNPMGGCLPILIQMPVFIALYWVLLESVELRHAPWILWIQDLSQMDPYFILPLIMGASMFVQQLLSPAPPDPMQAKVMKLMPIIFTFFFLWFPAGLVLYWVTNNLLSISQQWYITRKIEAETD